MAMSWVRLDIPCPHELADVVAAFVLAETGRGAGVAELPTGPVVQAWVPADQAPAVRARLTARLRLAGQFPTGPDHVSETPIGDEDWAYAWRRHFKPLRVGERLVVKPSWERWPPGDLPEAGRADDVVIEIDPGGAFGTGTHPSTQLALMALERSLRPGDLLVDVGCGSGILALAGLLLGAARAIALDFDPAAGEGTAQNLQDQGLADRAWVLLAEDLSALRVRADVIVANISADAVTRVGSAAVACLRPEGLYIGAGLLAEEAPRVQQELGRAGLALRDEDCLEGWASLTFARQE